jgi:hypothetical protein
MKIGTVIARVLLRLVFVVFGSNVFCIPFRYPATANFGWRLYQDAFPEPLPARRCGIPNCRWFAPAHRTPCLSRLGFASPRDREPFRSEALAIQLKDNYCGVTVTTLCPGPTDTDLFLKADLLETRASQKASVSAPQDVAKAGYEALMKGGLLWYPV